MVDPMLIVHYVAMDRSECRCRHLLDMGRPVRVVAETDVESKRLGANTARPRRTARPARQRTPRHSGRSHLPLFVRSLIIFGWENKNRICPRQQSRAYPIFLFIRQMIFKERGVAICVSTKNETLINTSHIDCGFCCASSMEKLSWALDCGFQISPAVTTG